MAALIDVQAFRSSIPGDVTAVAEQLRRDGRVGQPESAGGGARATVSDGTTIFEPWVGVTDRTFVGDCECGTGDDDFCVHAVAVALAAFDAGIRFSAEGDPNGPGPERADYRRAVEALDPRQLADLVVEQALRDRLFATLLLNKAGLLDPADETPLADFRATIRDASNATTGEWQIADVEAAGHRLVADAEILRAHPPVPAMLDLIEQAIEIWDDLAGHLIDAYYISRTDPDEISEPLADAHRDLCERLNLDPAEIADRLTRLTDQCPNETFDPTPYADLLGDQADTARRS